MAAPVLDTIEPATAVVGADDVVLRAIGSGFDDATVIVFNGGEEPTEFVSDSEVTTIVKPSTASGPWTVPVLVRNVDGDSDPIDFAFTEPVPEERTEVWNTTPSDLRLPDGQKVPAHDSAKVKDWNVWQSDDIVKSWLAAGALVLTDPDEESP